MVVKIKPEQLDEEIRKQLEFYSSKLTRTLNEKLEEVAAYSAKMLRNGGSYKERTGKYTKDWDYKRRGNYTPGILTEEFTVYNKKHYQLTHLLEKGHVSRSGKRVRAFEHIGPVEELAEQIVLSKVNEAVREANRL